MHFDPQDSYARDSQPLRKEKVIVAYLSDELSSADVLISADIKKSPRPGIVERRSGNCLCIVPLNDKFVGIVQINYVVTESLCGGGGWMLNSVNVCLLF
ncbi:hypothetical protein NPIL_595971 [Nephila pilipes]|uniref:Uncharacterized protein n=1 Tax=Nephila pilipes TaxID=299642 RepID=A0A8X6QZK2_NEPPI|nr:hypothetical protein NPIL_595971 [Nephila pilipes]